MLCNQDLLPEEITIADQHVPKKRAKGVAVSDTVLYDKDGHVVTITYHRPERMNAINGQMREELNAAWLRFRDDTDAWVAILTGAGEKAFCAGADLKKLIPLAFGSDGRPRSHNEIGLGGLTRGIEIWKPIIAAVNGYALAGGLELVLAAVFHVMVAEDRIKVHSIGY